MSWSLNVEIPKGTPPDEVYPLLSASAAGGNDECAGERDVAAEVALEAVFGILTEGVLGDVEEHGWNIVLSGHANPDNAPREGFCDDFLNIQITQKPQ